MNGKKDLAYIYIAILYLAKRNFQVFKLIFFFSPGLQIQKRYVFKKINKQKKNNKKRRMNAE